MNHALRQEFPIFNHHPALAYLDVVTRVRAAVDVPVAAYNVSGEYAAVAAAAERGWLDRDATVMESLLGIRRAGADVILTYWAALARRSLSACQPVSGCSEPRTCRTRRHCAAGCSRTPHSGTEPRPPPRSAPRLLQGW